MSSLGYSFQPAESERTSPDLTSTQIFPNLSLNQNPTWLGQLLQGEFFHSITKFKSPVTNAKNGGVIIHPSINPSNEPPIQANRKHSLASSVPGV